MRSIKVPYQLSNETTAWKSSLAMSLDSRHRPGMFDSPGASIRRSWSGRGQILKADTSVVRPSPLFHFVTPPRTPENWKYHGKFPNPELSSRRRLFPRRTVLPVLTIPDTDPKPNFSPFEVYSAPSRRFADVDDQLVDNGSSCSRGSTKILRLSTLDLWSEDTMFDLEDSPSKAVLSSRPRHVGAAALREKTPLDKLPDFGGSVLEDYLCELDDNAVDPPKVDEQASVATESTPVAGSETRLNDSIHRVKSWDSAITVCTTASISEDGRVSVRHHVDMIVVVPKVYIPEERVRLSIMVSKGLQASEVRNLEPGLSSLFFEEAVPNPEDQEIIVDRDTCDLELPLKLYLTFSYPLQRHHYVVATVPTFRPHQGTTLSEKVFIDKPSRPLVIKPLARNHLSSWKSKSSPGSHVTRFERVPMPRLYPEEFKDDIRIKIMDPSPVCFESLSDLDPCELVWNLDITVEEVLGARLECDLSFNLEVGKRNPVVALDAHGWRPKYFAIDGRLVTEQAGAWRENEKGYVAFYKREAMAHGPIRVETHWQEPKKENFNSASKADIPLPRVTDLRIVGGRLTCKEDKSEESSRPAFYTSILTMMQDCSFSAAQEQVAARMPASMDLKSVFQTWIQVTNCI